MWRMTYAGTDQTFDKLQQAVQAGEIMARMMGCRVLVAGHNPLKFEIVRTDDSHVCGEIVKARRCVATR